MTTLRLKDWNEDDRPREKLMMKGPVALSDAELIAILLRSGTRNYTVMDIAKHILSMAGNNLTELGKLEVKQLQEIKGMGLTKSVTLLSALELGRRRAIAHQGERPFIRQGADVQNIIGPLLADLPYEEFWVLALNQAGRLIDKKKVAHGGISSILADIRIIFKFALEKFATRLILVHNHPSGEKIPSMNDRKLTIRLKDAGKLLDINIIDHIIIAGDSYFSFTEEGLL
jgi:DNA repair protein RadC